MKKKKFKKKANNKNSKYYNIGSKKYYIRIYIYIYPYCVMCALHVYECMGTL